MESSETANDEAVRSTNDDATSCKRFAVQQGYWNDPYIQYFVRSSERKAPEINRGYYARVHGVKGLLKQFLEATKCQCQILNLGAGFDTTYWLLKDQGILPTRYIEVDFPGVTNRKCYYIKMRKPLHEKLSSVGQDVSIGKYDVHSNEYHVIGTDLRKLDELEKKLAECGLDKSLPTLVIAECVLVYMKTSDSSNLLRWLAENFSDLAFCNYEQVNMTDRFGEVMIQNLIARNCSLSGVGACESLESQKKRFLDTGWEGVDAWDMNTIYRNLPGAELQRIEKLEFLDDKEIFEQLLHHYCITWAYKDSAKNGLNDISLIPVMFR